MTVQIKYSDTNCESLEIPESGSELWCTAWKRGKTILKERRMKIEHFKKTVYQAQ